LSVSAVNVQRIVAVQDILPFSGAGIPADYSALKKHHEYDRFSSDYGIVMDISPKGEVIRSDVFESGMPIFINGIVAGTPGDFAFGSNGNNPWFAALR